jgi:site-specific recombinase XerD
MKSTKTMSVFPFYDAPQSERLESWHAGYEKFLLHLSANWHPQTVNIYRRTFRNFFMKSRKLPWRVTTQDIQSFMHGLARQGYKPTTINVYVNHLDAFYLFCHQNAVDPKCKTYFNPAESVVRLSVKLYSNAVVLTSAEIQALLQAIRAEPSILSLRDYAFVLTRLLLGDNTKYILEM